MISSRPRPNRRVKKMITYHESVQDNPWANYMSLFLRLEWRLLFFSCVISSRARLSRSVKTAYHETVHKNSLGHKRKAFQTGVSDWLKSRLQWRLIWFLCVISPPRPSRSVKTITYHEAVQDNPLANYRRGFSQGRLIRFFLFDWFPVVRGSVDV